MTDFRARLEPFLLLAPSTKGASAAKVVMDATAAPGVYVFGELLALPNIQQLGSDPATSKQLALLELFAYDDLPTYNKSYPQLTPAHITKLKHLTLTSLALQHRSLPYSTLQTALDVSTVRELEDLIIDVIYAGLLRGKMQHHEQILHVDWVAGRDLRKEDWVSVKQRLDNWLQTTGALLTALDEEIASAQQAAQTERQSAQAYSDQRNVLFAQALDKAWTAQSTRPKGGFAGIQNPGLGYEGPIPVGRFDEAINARGQKRQRD